MHNHPHDKESNSSAMGWAFFLNTGFTIIEFVGGWLTNSTAIMADAVHDLGDSLSIGLAWYLGSVSRKDATENFTYGFQRFSLLGALVNGVVLVAGSIWVLSEAVPRLWKPEMPDATGMVLLAVFGVAVNGFAAYKLSRGKSLNERILNWHLLEDVFGWAAVLIVAVLLIFFEWPILDPILSIGFTVFILVNVVRNLVETVRIFLQGSPDSRMRKTILEELSSISGVQAVHHLHIWSLDGENHVLTVHLLLEDNSDIGTQEAVKEELSRRLGPYNLSHTTVELEFYNETCRDLHE